MVYNLVIENNLSDNASDINSIITQNRKVIISSETGSGKSYYIFNYLIPYLKKINSFKKHIIVCATPLKFLTIQQKNYLELSELSYEIVCQGYTSAKRLDEDILGKTEVIQTTFESLKMVYKKIVEFGYSMTLIIDEFHQIVTSASYMKLGLINKIMDDSDKVIGLSGTIKDLYLDYFKDSFSFIDVVSTKNKIENIRYQIIDDKKKIEKELCNNLLNRNTENKLLIFLNDIKKIERCMQFCSDNNINASRIHRGLSKVDINENKTIKKIFQDEIIDDNVDVLFATSILDTGINIKNNNIEIWYVSTPNDNDIIKFEQSIARYRNPHKSIKLFLVSQKREEMYKRLLTLKENFHNDIELYKYYKNEINYIEKCIEHKNFIFNKLQPNYYKPTYREILYKVSEYNYEIEKLNKIVSFKKELGLENIKIDFIKGHENVELNNVLDYVYRDDNSYYKLNNFKLYDFFRKEEIKTIGNYKFLELIKKPYRNIFEEGNDLSLETEEIVQESVDKFEKTKDNTLELLYKTLLLEVSDNKENDKKTLRNFMITMIDLVEDEWKNEFSYFYTRLESHYSITLNYDHNEIKKFIHNKNYNPLFTTFYKDVLFSLKSIIKIYSLIKRFNSVEYLQNIPLSEVIGIVKESNTPFKFNKKIKEIGLVLNQYIWNKYKPTHIRTKEIIEYQTFFYENVVKTLSKLGNKETEISVIIETLNKLPQVPSININKWKNEHYVRLFKQFFEIKSKRKKVSGKHKTYIKFITKKGINDFFSQFSSDNIRNTITIYFNEYNKKDELAFLYETM